MRRGSGRRLAALGLVAASMLGVAPASATLLADGRYDVAVVDQPSPDAAFWQDANLASVMRAAPGSAPFRLSYVSHQLADVDLSKFDVLVVSSNVRWWATAGISAAAAAFVAGGGVMVVAPGNYYDPALFSDPLFAGFGAGYEIGWRTGDSVDTGCSSPGTTFPSKSYMALTTPADPILLAPNTTDTVFTDCDHVILGRLGTSFTLIGAAYQYRPDGRRLGIRELATATYGQGRILVSTASFAHNTVLHQKLAENLISTARVPEAALPADTTAPTLTVSTLPTVVSSPTLYVSGEAQDASSIWRVEIMLNGVVVATPTLNPKDSSYQAQVTLASGANDVTVRALDAAGNVSTRSATVTLDDTAPDVHVTSALRLTNDPSYLLTGTVTDRGAGLRSVRLEVNGVSVAAPTPLPDGTVSGQVRLIEGANVLEIEANDLVGNYARDLITVTLDTAPPSVRALSVPTLTRSAALTVVGVASDANGIASTAIRVDGALIATPTPSADGLFSAPVTLLPGHNAVLVQAVDAAGNVSADQVDVVLDDSAPEVSVISPLPGQSFGTSTVPLTISVTDASTTTIDIDGRTTVLDPGSSRFSTFVSFGDNAVPREGVNTVSITTTDAAGNASTTTLDVILDFSAPIVSADVADGALIGPQPNDQLLLTVHVDDLSATQVAIAGGAPIALPPGGGVAQAAVPLVAGQNAVPVTVTDELGHTSTMTRAVIYDVTPPTGAFAGAGAARIRGTAELSVTASDDLGGVAGVQLSIDGGAAIAMDARDGVWSAAVDTTALADGAHTATATMIDRVGNQAVTQMSFAVDNTPPTVAVTAPAGNAYLPGVITVSASASDGGSGVAGVALSVNGAPIASCAGTSTCSATFDTRRLADGPFLVSATATDTAGNEAAPAQQTAYADNNAPAKFLVSPLPGAIVKGSMSVAISTTDATFASVDCAVDGVSLGRSTSPTFQTLVDLLATKLDGPVDVRCAATDLAGNVGVEAASVTLKNWNSTLSPRYTSQLFSSTAATIGFSVDGPDPSIRQLIPWSSLGLTLVVPGAPPVPLSATVSPGVFPHAPRLNVVFYFDRAAVVSAIRAGAAVGAIDLTRSFPIQLVSRGRVLGTDLMRADSAPKPI